MTDIVEEARAMLAQETTWPWEAVDEYHAALIATAPRLLAALADECERLLAENARLLEAMPSDSVRSILDDAHRDDGGDSGYPGEVTAWLARLDAAKGVR